MIEVDVAGVRVTAASFEEALGFLERCVACGDPAVLCCANAWSLVLATDDAEHRARLNRADFVMADGMPLVWLLRALGAPAERVHGDDLLLGACRAYPEWRHFLLGGAEGQPERVAEALVRHVPQLTIAGWCATPRRPLDVEETEGILETIAASDAQVVWVAMGTPAQDAWMDAHGRGAGVPMVGVGSAFDWLSGRTRRAPAPLRSVGLQWLHRLAQEPARLGPRYLRSNPRFAWLALRQLLASGPGSRRRGNARLAQRLPRASAGEQKQDAGADQERAISAEWLLHGSAAERQQPESRDRPRPQPSVASAWLGEERLFLSPGAADDQAVDERSRIIADPRFGHRDVESPARAQAQAAGAAGRIGSACAVPTTSTLQADMTRFERLQHGYRYVSLRPEDIEALRRWRNEQIEILRQKRAIAPDEQERWYHHVVVPTHASPEPEFLLVSILDPGDRLVGYGGLTHIDWEHRRAEVSFLVAPERARNHRLYARDMAAFLKFLRRWAFEELDLHRLFSETYAFRRLHMELLEEAGFVLEGRLRDHVRGPDGFVDSLIHGIVAR